MTSEQKSTLLIETANPPQKGQLIQDLINDAHDLGEQKGRREAVKWIVNNFRIDCDFCQYDKMCNGNNYECESIILEGLQKEKANG